MMTHCLICGSTEITALTPFDDKQYEVERCNGCQYETIRPLPTPAALQDYYSGYSTTKTDDADLTFLFERSLTFLKFFIERARIEESHLAQLNFLEIGFGNAASLLAAAQVGFRSYGIDLDEVSVMSAKDRAAQYEIEIDCASSDIHSYRRDIPFHIVKASQIIEHTLSPLEFLSDIYDRQPPGGYLILECPNNEAAFWRVKNMLRKQFDRMSFYKSLKIKEHLSGFTASNLVLLLEKVGYSTVYCRDYAFRDRLFQPETLLWYPTLTTGIARSLRFRTVYPFLKSLIPPFDAMASTLARSGTHLAVWARK